MATIVLDSELKAKLNGLNEHMEVRDVDGKTLGHFLPAGLYQELIQARVKAQFSDRGERDQARHEVLAGGGLSTAAAVSHLENVARTAKGQP